MFTCLSFCGIVLVVRPSFIFGSENDSGLSVLGVVAGLIAALGAGLVRRTLFCDDHQTIMNKNTISRYL